MKKLLSVFTLVLGILILFEYVNLEERQNRHEDTIYNLKKDKADEMFNYITTKELQAQQAANDIKDQIILEFNKEYTGREDVLIKELDDIITGQDIDSRALEIIGNIIDGYSLNGIKGNAKDNNDPIIMLKDLIVGDLSFNCAGEDRVRTIEAEMSKQFASMLSKEAMIDISRKGKSSTFWHFLPVYKESPWYEFVKTSKTPDLSILRQKYIDYDVNDEFLKGYEFLVVERINNRTDYFGNKVITSNGTLVGENYQFHIIQGFNVIDQLNIDLAVKAKLKDYDSAINMENNQFIAYKAQMHLQIAVTVMLFILLFLYVERRR